MTDPPPLTVAILRDEAAVFAADVSQRPEPSLFGVTDGKAIGTLLEQKFRSRLAKSYRLTLGNSARGIDFPDVGVDMKVTSVTQPQSSSPFRSARQKTYGLGYGLLILVYEKADDRSTQSATLNIRHTLFIEPHRTADFTTTRLLRETLAADGNADDLVAVMLDRNLPLDEIEAGAIAEELVKKPCEQGYLTISNALQWRLQYGRAITEAGTVTGVDRLA